MTAQINRVIDVTNWESPDNFIVEDDILKQIVGCDVSLFSADLLKFFC